MSSAARARHKHLILVGLMWAVAAGASWLVYRTRDAAQPADVIVTQTKALPERAHTLAPLLADVPGHFRLDRRHTGLSPHRGPDRGTTRWKRALDQRVTAQPVVDAQGNIYVATHAGVLWSLTSEGIVRWQRELGARIYAAPLVAPDGNIYVGTDAQRFFGLDPAGNPRFELRTDGDADTAATLGADGLIRFAAGHTLYAITDDGAVVWRFVAGDKIFSSPTLDDDGSAYFGSQDDHVYAVDAKGKLRWKHRTSGDVDVSPALDDRGTLYVGSDDQHVYALDSGSGTVRWAEKLDGFVRGAIALAPDASVLATCFGPRGALVALDRQTGTPRFRFAFTLTESTEAGVRGGPLVDNRGAIYVAADDDYLYALSPEGKLRWAFATGSDLDASTILTADGTLYAVSALGLVHAIGGNE